MSDIKVRVVGESSNMGVFDDASGKIKGLADIARDLGGGAGGLTDLKAGFDLVTGSISGMVNVGKEIYQFADSTNKLGMSVANIKRGFEGVGQTAGDLQRLISVTEGLVDDTDLMADATQALSAGAVRSNAQLQELVRTGAILGATFQDSAQGGIETLTRILEMPGQTRGLKQLGLDAEAVTKEFERLKATGMSVGDAWSKSILGNAATSADRFKDALHGTGTEFEKLKNQIHGIGEDMAEGFAHGLDVTINVARNFINGAGENLTYYQNQVKAAIDVTKELKNTTENWHAPMAAQDWRVPMSPLPQSTLPSNMVPFGPLPQTANPNASNNALLPGVAPSPVGRTIDQVIADAAAMNKIMSHRAMTADEQYIKAAQDLNAAAAQQKVAANAQMEAARHTGLKGAFGLNQTGTAGEMQGALEQGMQQRRQQLQKQGYSKQQLELVDQQDKMALDAYKLATGAATKESLKFDDTVAQLTKTFTKGKMSSLDYAKSIDQLSQMAENGTASLHNLDIYSRNLTNQQTYAQNQHKPKGQRVAATAGDAQATGLDGSGFDNSTTGKTVPTDPFKSYQDSAKKAQDAIDKMNTATVNLGKYKPNMSGMFDTMKPAATGAIVQLERVNAKKMEVAKTITARINIVATVNGNPVTMPGG